ncbi:M23 family metallopeptidase [Microbacterium sp. cx-55]|uniref:murein hydrolase activator EnvC family protein n=1 Tax=unclassified Microbacterium TaxID=2609290 RepID=UPI001CC02AC9|nr:MULTISPECIES: M23 family metallopeptidase [unclassified Microbacterium]MBZ4486141.1 M23 family metallopeptidase [Microbacterium sp. cx-55]MCC4907132.1 M23 family metallopeptidase [Microbacterium sp. cx-59]UGB33988.1 M23 family metallopeptidase [Microbacterium sp. cx-55]
MISSSLRRCALAVILAAAVAAAVGAPAAASVTDPSSAGSSASAPPVWSVPEDTATVAEWVWPAPGIVSRAYQQPADAYAAGHRGIDILVGTTSIRAPGAGTVVFAGMVVDRPLLTIDHGGGLVSTLEPVTTELTAGASVAQGEVVGDLASGGHARPGELHLGARQDGEYVNPLLLLGDVPRAVLLPCC